MPKMISEHDQCHGQRLHIVADQGYRRAFRNLRATLRTGGYFVPSETRLPRDSRVEGQYVNAAHGRDLLQNRGCRGPSTKLIVCKK